jgi:hypothetical protein
MEMDSDEVTEEISQLQNLIEDEKDKIKRYKIEVFFNFLKKFSKFFKCIF